MSNSNPYNLGLHDLLVHQRNMMARLEEKQLQLRQQQQQHQQRGMKFVAERMKMYQNAVDFDLANLSHQVHAQNQEAHRQLRLQRHCVSIESLSQVASNVKMPPRIDPNRGSPVVSKIRDMQSEVNGSYPSVFHEIAQSQMSNG